MVMLAHFLSNYYICLQFASIFGSVWLTLNQFDLLLIKLPYLCSIWLTLNNFDPRTFSVDHSGKDLK